VPVARAKFLEAAKQGHTSTSAHYASGIPEIDTDKLIVHFDRRSHNPVLREAALDRDCPPIRWIGNLPIVFRYS
jgi:hypothetical protein